MNADPFAPDEAKTAEMQALIERLCKLQEQVCDHVLGYDRANDCLCGRGWMWETGPAWPAARSTWRSSGEAVAWIEAAVMAEIARSKRRFARTRRVVQWVYDTGARVEAALQAAKKAPAYFDRPAP